MFVGADCTLKSKSASVSLYAGVFLAVFLFAALGVWGPRDLAYGRLQQGWGVEWLGSFLCFIASEGREC